MTRKPTYEDLEQRIRVLEEESITIKQAEELLRESEEEYRILLSESPDPTFSFTPEGQYRYVNKAFAEGVGKPVEAIIGKNIWDVFPKEEADKRFASLSKVFHTGKEQVIEVRVPRADGDRYYITTITPIKDTKKEMLYAICSSKDITERKLVEKAKWESEERFRQVAESLQEAVWSSDLSGKYDYLSPIMVHIYGRPLSEMIGNQDFWIESAHPEDQAAVRASGEALLRNSRVELEYRIILPDGTVRWVADRKLLLRNEHGEPYKITGILSDITERRLTEENVKASLREKEILLSEVHHRVKNNMQVISGLLDLQAKASGNPELTERLNESQRRIRSMALIHEKLYGSKDFARIDLADYVRTLSQELFQSQKINLGEIDLIVQTDGSNVYVDINKAIPCGLILNELISNALKHAFPGDGPGELRIIIHETKNTEIEIIVRDNGLGLPDDIDIHQPRTVGLHLVYGLVTKQLDGQIEVRRGAGTEFQITIPYDLSEERLL